MATSIQGGGARRARWLGAALALACLGLAPAAAGASDVCVRLARELERREGIPPGLVEAVALTESGRWLQEEARSVPWPWTVTSGRETFYLDSKAAALAKVRELQAAGRTNIDVGCMQVNLVWHGHAFASVDHALEPEHNVAYGAGFLKRLRHETRSWGRATAKYHSRHPARGEAYRERVYARWNEVRQRLAGERGETRAAGAIMRGGRIVPGPAGMPRILQPAAGGETPPGAIVLRGG
jgi:hypothetical protein